MVCVVALPMQILYSRTCCLRKSCWSMCLSDTRVPCKGLCLNDVHIEGEGNIRRLNFTYHTVAIEVAVKIFVIISLSTLSLYRSITIVCFVCHFHFFFVLRGKFKIVSFWRRYLNFKLNFRLDKLVFICWLKVLDTFPTDANWATDKRTGAWCHLTAHLFGVFSKLLVLLRSRSWYATSWWIKLHGYMVDDRNKLKWVV